MRKKNYKGRCVKFHLTKADEVCRTYDDIQREYVQALEQDNDVRKITTNYVLDGEAEGYTTDILYVLESGETAVRECVQRDKIMKPMNVKLLDISRSYWLKHGISNWGIVTNGK